MPFGHRVFCQKPLGLEKLLATSLSSMMAWPFFVDRDIRGIRYQVGEKQSAANRFRVVSPFGLDPDHRRGLSVLGTGTCCATLAILRCSSCHGSSDHGIFEFMFASIAMQTKQTQYFKLERHAKLETYRRFSKLPFRTL